MDQEKIKEIVSKYITDSVDCDAADCLHERDEWAEFGEDEQDALEAAYTWFGKARVTVTFDA